LSAKRAATKATEMRNKLAKLFGHRKVSGVDGTLALGQVHRPLSVARKSVQVLELVIYWSVLFPSQLTRKTSGSQA